MQFAREMGASRSGIIETLAENGLRDPVLVRMLDYTIGLFESRGLGEDYYGYHNIHHELAVTYVMLLSACSKDNPSDLSDSDVKHLYAAALLHDFDPLKSVDKPHEKRVLNFISGDPPYSVDDGGGRHQPAPGKGAHPAHHLSVEGGGAPPGPAADGSLLCGC